MFLDDLDPISCRQSRQKSDRPYQRRITLHGHALLDYLLGLDRVGLTLSFEKLFGITGMFTKSRDVEPLCSLHKLCRLTRVAVVLAKYSYIVPANKADGSLGRTEEFVGSTNAENEK